MEGKEGINDGVTVKGDEAPESYRVAPRSDPPSQYNGQVMAATPAVVVAAPGMQVKKKRGRPRKYDQDRTATMSLSPMPISASIPLTGEFSGWKRGIGRPMDSYKKQQKYEGQSAGGVAYSIGANFTPHIITVNAGEDVTMKIMSFSQQGSRSICIISANGTISNVTLRQPNSYGGTLTYEVDLDVGHQVFNACMGRSTWGPVWEIALYEFEGRFEIVSLSGSFMPTESAGTKSRSGGMSVSLAGPDGRVVGGGLAGMLVAAGPVQVVVGSFLQGHQQEQKKKQKIEHTSVVTPYSTNSISKEDTNGVYGGLKPILISASFHADNSASFNNMHGLRNSATDNKTSLPGEESKTPGQSNCEVSC